MKKVYSKPEIMFEDFTLCANIAGVGCEKKVSTQVQDACAYETSGGIRTFTDSIDACDFTASDDMADGFCYHVPSVDYNLFNS